MNEPRLDLMERLQQDEGREGRLSVASGRGETADKEATPHRQAFQTKSELYSLSLEGGGTMQCRLSQSRPKSGGRQTETKQNRTQKKPNKPAKIPRGGGPNSASPAGGGTQRGSSAQGCEREPSGGG